MARTPDMLNFSHHQRTLPVAVARCWAAQGIAWVSPGSGPVDLGFGRYTTQQFDASLEAGLGLLPYLYLELDVENVRNRPRSVFVQAAIDQWIPYREHMPFVVADMEDADHGRGWSAAQRVAYYGASVRQMEAAGFEVVIYTRRQYWRDYMGSTPEWAGMRCWDAGYAGPEAPFKSYGGMITVADQWNPGTSEYCNFTTQPSKFTPAFRQEVGDMGVDQEARDLVGRVLNILCGERLTFTVEASQLTVLQRPEFAGKVLDASMGEPTAPIVGQRVRLSDAYAAIAFADAMDYNLLSSALAQNANIGRLDTQLSEHRALPHGGDAGGAYAIQGQVVLTAPPEDG